MKFKNKILCLTLAIALLFVSMPSVSAVEVDDVSNVLSEDNEITQENNSIKQNADQPKIASTEETEIDAEFVYEWDDGLKSSEASKNDTVQSARSTQITTTGYIPDGVYALRNVANPNFWMDVQDDSIYPTASIQQTAYSSNPADTFTRPALFKISRIPNTNRYVIRLMTNNRLSFYETSDKEAVTMEISPRDTQVPINNTFYITYDTNGYMISPYHSPSFVLASQSTTHQGENARPYSNLKFTLKSSTDNKTKWQLYQYTGTAQSGTVIARTAGMGNGIVKGQSGTIWLKTWSTVIGVNTPYLSIDSAYSNIASLTWNASTYSATVTGLVAGDLPITAHTRYDGTQTDYRTSTYKHVVIPDIVGGTAYVQNVATSRYIDLEQVNYVPTDIVQQWSFHTGTQAQWIFELGGGGYFKIKSVKTEKYIGVVASDITKVKQYSSATDYTLWKISETSSGNYKFACKALESSGKVLCAPATTSGDGVDLTMLVYGDNSSYTDEWKIYPIEYSIEVKNYYDQGFAVRYTGINPNTQSLVITYQLRVAERFARIFGLNVVPTYSQFTSSADSCKISNYGSVQFTNLANNCTHSPTHLTTTILRNDLGNGTQIRSVIIWTGHILTGNPRSNSSSTRYSIVITPYIVTNEDEGHTNKPVAIVTMESIFTLTHETSHQLGAPDHYCYDKDNTPCRNPHCDVCVYGFDAPRSCIMSYRYDLSTITDEDMYCSECEAAINAHLEDHH